MAEIPPLGINRPHRGQFGGVRGGGLKPAGSSGGGKSSMNAIATPGLVGGTLVMALVAKAVHLPAVASVALFSLVCVGGLIVCVVRALKSAAQTS